MINENDVGIGNKQRNIITLIIIGFMIIMVVTSKATIINIPDDYVTIQEGVDASTDYDTILVAPGHYIENVFLNEKEILLSSHFMFDQNADYIFNTIIDGSSQVHPDTGSTILIKSSGGFTFTKIQGFTITGGTGTLFEWSPGYHDRQGGGIMLDNSAATIQYNYISGNKAVNTAGAYSAGGGGIQSQLGNACVRNNIIVYNEGLYGGGVSYNNCTGLIKNNVIAYNYGGQHYSGSGIQKNSGGATVIENNTIVYNISSLQGAGIRVFFASPVISNNIIWFNEAPSDAQIYGFSNTSYCNVQDGGVSGTGNIDIDPELTLDNCLFLRDGSPCIDAGIPSEMYYDIADSSDPSSAKWPSLGGLRNDIGAYGGLGAFPFKLIGVYADTTFGWAPLDVSFNAYTGSDIDSWHWDFGDGSSSELQSPQYQYTSSGLYDVTVQAITSDYDTVEQTIYGIAVLADSLVGPDQFSTAGSMLIISLIGRNTCPLNTVFIPLEIDGTIDMDFDSISVIGSRTEYFESVSKIYSDSYLRRWEYKLVASASGALPNLEPGYGEIAKFYFTIPYGANSSQIDTVKFSGFSTHLPKFITEYGTYAPMTENSEVTLGCCALRGDVASPKDYTVLVNDIVTLVNYLFKGGTAPSCIDEGDCAVPLDGAILVNDIVTLVNYLLKGGAAPPSC
ncbi:MAG: PKD domain-containing protein [bacterium]